MTGFQANDDQSVAAGRFMIRNPLRRVSGVLFCLLFMAGAVLAEPDSGAVALSNPTGWLESDELQKVWSEMGKRRMLPIEINGQVENTQILYNATFVPFPPDTNYYYTYWGLTDAWFRKYDSELAAEGYQVFSHSTFYDAGGSVLNNATWVLVGDLLPKDPWEKAVEKIDAMIDRVTGIFDD